ncbi:MAG: VWA domain-containing protein [Candidatus Bathyarchaeota archaeon]|nr:VWA domain-containing protein [Candidatus Bathyarchaeota archaeon]
MKTGISIETMLNQPTLTQTSAGFDVTVPLPVVSVNEETEEKSMAFLGYNFLVDDDGKARVGRLFRACVYHLTTHTLMPQTGKKLGKPKRVSILDRFVNSFVNDIYVNSYLAAWYPDKFADIAYANSLAYSRLRPVNKIFNPATRIMTALISKVNIGTIKGTLNSEEEQAVNEITTKATTLKDEIMMALAMEGTDFGEAMINTANDITQTLENYGPILEAPSLPYTEYNGSCTILSKTGMPSDFEMEQTFRKSLETLGGTIPSEDSIESCWRKETNVEASQAFNTWLTQDDREKRMLSKLENAVAWTRFKSTSFPKEDYTTYLRAKEIVRGTIRRLLNTLCQAQDALDEDAGKLYGEMDMPAVVQMMTSGTPRQDIFKLDEYLKSSYAWSIVLDASASMRVKGEYGRALAICVAEAANELLKDHASWSFIAFSDQLHVLKYASEAYSRRVRARIGGLKFGGLTYMPDALHVAGELLAERFDEQKFVVVLSDGWPYGYKGIPLALSESITALERKGIMVIGVGFETDRMQNFFRRNAAVYDQRDLVKKFANVYVRTSENALEG